MAAILKLFNSYLGPATDQGLDLGTDEYRFANFYLAGIFNFTGTIQTDSTTGVTIGSAISEKVGFYGVTPVIQPTSTTDLRQALINLGLLADGGATPLNLNGGAFTTSGPVTIGPLQLDEGTNFVFNNDQLISLNDDVVFL